MHAHKLVKAKDPQEAFALQSEYLKSQIAALQEQAKEIGELIAHVGREAVSPLRPGATK